MDDAYHDDWFLSRITRLGHNRIDVLGRLQNFRHDMLHPATVEILKIALHEAIKRRDLPIVEFNLAQLFADFIRHSRTGATIQPASRFPGNGRAVPPVDELLVTHEMEFVLGEVDLVGGQERARNVEGFP